MKPLRSTDPPAVGGFTLLGRLGVGGMGHVYLGVTRSGRPVAVKVIKPEIAADPAFRTRFVREVAAARQVGGFWTASVVAADPEAEQPWLATEYVPGPSLREAVAQLGPLPEPVVRIVAARLAEALSAIHATGLVHRDLKPANVLLAPDGPMVIDFGIARTFAPGTAGHTAVIGTPSYMAPEQVRGQRLSPATDVFALGGTLVYALCGRGPFSTGAPEGIVYRVVAEPPDMSGVPDGQLRELVAACLAKEPGERPATGELLHRLHPQAGRLVPGYGGWRPPEHDPAAALAAPAGPPAAEPPGPPPEPAVPPVATTVPVGVRPVGVRPGRLVARRLLPGERPLAQWRQHPAGLAPVLAAGAGAVTLLALLAGYAVRFLHAAWFASIPILLGTVVLGWLAVQVQAWRLSRFVLTDQRVLAVRWGPVGTQVAALPLPRVGAVRHRPTLAGRLFGYATVTVESTGPDPDLPELRYLPEPGELCRLVAAAGSGSAAAGSGSPARLGPPHASRRAPR